jgi:hypothetical protein
MADIDSLIKKKWRYQMVILVEYIMILFGIAVILFIGKSICEKICSKDG